MKRLFFLNMFVIISSLAGAQVVDTTIVKVTGNIIDEITKEPVQAKIKYESLPYSSKIGVFSGSTFDFTMAKGSEYLFSVSAKGYIPYEITLKTSESVDGIINKTVKLKSTSVNKLIRLEKLIFALGKATISEASYEELDELVALLSANPNMEIQLEGHTDFRGNEKLNMNLSEDRVDAVKDYMVNKGIDRRRIKTKAFGGSKPLSRGSDAESRRKNRRVEVRILSN